MEMRKLLSMLRALMVFLKARERVDTTAGVVAEVGGGSRLDFFRRQRCSFAKKTLLVWFGDLFGELANSPNPDLGSFVQRVKVSLCCFSLFVSHPQSLRLVTSALKLVTG